MQLDERLGNGRDVGQKKTTRTRLTTSTAGDACVAPTSACSQVGARHVSPASMPRPPSIFSELSGKLGFIPITPMPWLVHDAVGVVAGVAQHKAEFGGVLL